MERGTLRPTERKVRIDDSIEGQRKFEHLEKSARLEIHVKPYVPQIERPLRTNLLSNPATGETIEVPSTNVSVSSPRQPR